MVLILCGVSDCIYKQNKHYVHKVNNEINLNNEICIKKLLLAK